MTEEITFTEAEAKLSADFFNFVFTNASWQLTSKQVVELARLFGGYGPLQRKIDSHIMELKEVIQKPDTKKAKK